MSHFSRNRKKRWRYFISLKQFFGKPNWIIDHWEIIDIHEIPNTVSDVQEYDFYCHNSKDFYLLRIRASNKNAFHIKKSYGLDHRIYLIAELPFKQVDDKLIRQVLSTFTKRGIPKYSRQKIHINNL